MNGLELDQWERRLLRRLTRAGGVVVKSYENEDKTFIIEGSGRVASRSVDRLIEKGLLVPVPDGMFGEAQTYRLESRNHERETTP